MRKAGTVLLFAVVLAALGSSAAFADPPGNNGTVKIDGVEFSQLPNNEPHPGCIFDVEFFNFDAGVGDATVTFALHPPTGTEVLLVDTVDNDGDAAGGGQDFDGEELYDLSDELAASGATPHPQQGFHIKLTVNAPGSIGSDVKHKVFWVECQYAPTGRMLNETTGTGSPVSFAEQSGRTVFLTAAALVILGLAAMRFLKARV